MFSRKILSIGFILSSLLFIPLPTQAKFQNPRMSDRVEEYVQDYLAQKCWLTRTYFTKEQRRDLAKNISRLLENHGSLLSTAEVESFLKNYRLSVNMTIYRKPTKSEISLIKKHQATYVNRYLQYLKMPQEDLGRIRGQIETLCRFASKQFSEKYTIVSKNLAIVEILKFKMNGDYGEQFSFPDLLNNWLRAHLLRQFRLGYYLKPRQEGGGDGSLEEAKGDILQEILRLKNHTNPSEVAEMIFDGERLEGKEKEQLQTVIYSRIETEIFYQLYQKIDHLLR